MALLLQKNGSFEGDRLEIRRSDPELGSVTLNDYWNGFHKEFDSGRYYQKPGLFYQDGHIPILGIHQSMGEGDLGSGLLIFRPCDVSLRGIGMYLVHGLPEETQDATDIIVTSGPGSRSINPLIRDPLNDMNVVRMIQAIDR
jgi:hypothetical protein